MYERTNERTNERLNNSNSNHNGHLVIRISYDTYKLTLWFERTTLFPESKESDELHFLKIALYCECWVFSSLSTYKKQTVNSTTTEKTTVEEIREVKKEGGKVRRKKKKEEKEEK